ncbi:hypothetical protein IAQ61_010165 [Plenodomus lingam]|uniref:Similar to transcription factor Rba50 n=1 Tax=Leptosphaeria maculans (strain JN3 / isolate v23.1.3 / race Av1-4-5-6-7-8) TaxID=985895 RepID=E5A348_LEPMJ|nr:similar to transcription factor Rba50 [Plenodomus lingam JN3]KAH9861964.1 hypothetical protein IAQ61_010165 [Plenodomus lingam]CBX98061.1 similar to transcription factor Rba50 [Plenodomus lingam JN3]
MEFQRGERVNLNFDTGTVERLEPEVDHTTPTYTFPSFIGDIQERDSSQSTPPVAPLPKANANGFPAHKKRQPKESAFKRQRASRDQQAVATASKPQAAPKPSSAGFDADAERKAIDEENRRTLAVMSDAEIEQERQDLMSSLSPELLQKLLMRSSLNDGSNERDLYPEESPGTSSIADREDSKPNQKGNEFTRSSASNSSSMKKVSFTAQGSNHESPPREAPTTGSHISGSQSLSRTTTPLPDTVIDAIHFPRPPQLPELDPNDPSFLKDLHAKYFPSLPYDPSKLSWMAPIDPSDKSSPYHPSQTGLNATELRFDFKGALLPPSVARSLPSDRGLHHHADAPEAAGYTIPELAVLARSKVAAQRCMAYQTLGRILYRLGQGEFGVEKARQDTDGPVQVVQDPDMDDEGDEEDVGSAMAAGLWSCIEEGRVIETLTEEANRTRGHLTARTLAQEALWNWRRGGGRKRHAV